MYITERIILRDNGTADAGGGLYGYLDCSCERARCLYNAALFRIRQVFTGWDKEKRTPNEEEVFAEVSRMRELHPKTGVRRVLSYTALDRLMRDTENPDFFSGLPMQSAQNVLKQAVSDFSSWLRSLKEYRQSPDKYTGKPKMPGYKKCRISSYAISNQDAVLYPVPGGYYLKLPKTKQTVRVTWLPEGASPDSLMEVTVKPAFGVFTLCLCFLVPDSSADSTGMPETAAIDFGVDNTAAIVCTDGSCRIYKGGAILAGNQWFEKKKAEAVSTITRGHEHMHADSRRLRALSLHRDCFNRDQMHKTSRDIVRYCQAHRVGTLVLGVNRGWKQRADLGSVNNQKFVQVPLYMLRGMIRYKAGAAGIRVVEQEESYTSKADVTAGDCLPVYGKDDGNACFSGRRIRRGLYRCHDGLVINADCNGAANIMRKAFPDVWGGRTDFRFLSQPEVRGFHELNPKPAQDKRSGLTKSIPATDRAA